MSQSKYFSISSYRVRKRALIFAIVAGLGVAELGLGTGFLINRPYLLLLPLGPLVVLKGSSRLELGALAVLFCDLLIKIGISTGTETKIPVSLIITGIWGGLWLARMALDRDIRFTPSSVNLPMLVFLGIVLVSLPWSRFFVDPQVVIYSNFLIVQLATIGVTVLSVGLLLLCLNLVRQVLTVKITYWLTLVVSLYYLPLYLTNTPDPLGVDLRGLFPLWFCCISLSLLLNYRELTGWQRLWITIVFSGWLFRLFVVTIVRISGWLPVLVGMLVILFFYSRKLFFIVSLLGVLLIVLNYQLIYEVVVVAKEQEGTLAGDTSRESLWLQAFQVSQDHLLLGTGPAGYANYYVTYFRDHALSTHNNYLDMLLQYGLLGLGAFIWLCLAMVKQVWRSSRLQPHGSFEKAFTIGCFGGICGMLPAMWLGDWVIPFAYNQTIAGFIYTSLNWLFIGLALALGYIRVEASYQSPKVAKLEPASRSFA